MSVKEYINKNKSRFLDELFELLKIPSVSADQTFKKEVDKAAEYLVNQFNNLDCSGLKEGNKIYHNLFNKE